MNKISTTLAALLMTASAGAMAQATTNTTRDQRMNDALQDYRNGHASSSRSTNASSKTNTNGEGRFARTEDSVKSGSKKAGHAIAEGSRDAGHAVAQGARKTGHAIHNASDKATGKTPDSTSP